MFGIQTLRSWLLQPSHVSTRCSSRRLALEVLEQRETPSAYTWNPIGDLKYRNIQNWFADGAPATDIPNADDKVTLGANSQSCILDVNATVHAFVIEEGAALYINDKEFAVTNGGPQATGRSVVHLNGGEIHLPNANGKFNIFTDAKDAGENSDWSGTWFDGENGIVTIGNGAYVAEKARGVAMVAKLIIGNNSTQVSTLEFVGNIEGLSELGLGFARDLDVGLKGKLLFNNTQYVTISSYNPNPNQINNYGIIEQTGGFTRIELTVVSKDDASRMLLTAGALTIQAQPTAGADYFQQKGETHIKAGAELVTPTRFTVGQGTKLVLLYATAGSGTVHTHGDIAVNGIVQFGEQNGRGNDTIMWIHRNGPITFNEGSVVLMHIMAGDHVSDQIFVDGGDEYGSANLNVTNPKIGIQVIGDPQPSCTYDILKVNRQNGESLDGTPFVGSWADPNTPLVGYTSQEVTIEDYEIFQITKAPLPF